MSRTAQDTELYTLLTTSKGWIVKNPLPVFHCKTLSEALTFAQDNILQKRKSPFIISKDETIEIRAQQIVRLIADLGF
jgi:hypothetical protein